MVERVPSWKSIIFVFIQFFTLGLIGLTGPIFADHPFLLALELTGLALGLWAVWIMRPGNFNITPDLQSSSVLVKKGPYRLIRHPMYLALLLTTFPLILDHYTIFRLFLWILLLVDLMLKINYEERILMDGLEDYRSYLKTSHRLIPHIY